MERGRFGRLRQEFPFVQDILDQTERLRKQPKWPQPNLTLKVQRVDENLLARTLRRSHGSAKAAIDFGDDWYYERLWAINGQGRVTEVRTKVVYVEDMPLEQPLLAYLGRATDFCYLVLAREEIPARGREYGLQLVVYKPSRQFELRQKVTEYKRNRQRELRRRQAERRARWVRFSTEGQYLIWCGRPFCYPGLNLILCEGFRRRVSAVEFFRRMRLDLAALSQIFVPATEETLGSDYFFLPFDERPRQPVAKSYKALEDRVLPMSDIEGWWALTKLVGKRIDLRDGYDEAEPIRVHCPDGIISGISP